MKIARVILIVLAIATTAARAGIVRWPMRIVETKYTLHRMTGLTSGETSKDKLTVVIVDISKATRDGETSIEFVRKTKLTDERETDTSRATIPSAETDTLLDAIAQVRKAMMRSASSTDSETTLFESTDLTAKHMITKRQHCFHLTFGDGSEFVLQAPHVQQLETALKRLR